MKKEEEEERKSVLTMVSTKAWTKICDIVYLSCSDNVYIDPKSVYQPKHFKYLLDNSRTWKNPFLVLFLVLCSLVPKVTTRRKLTRRLTRKDL